MFDWQSPSLESPLARCSCGDEGADSPLSHPSISDTEPPAPPCLLFLWPRENALLNELRSCKVKNTKIKCYSQTRQVRSYKWCDVSFKRKMHCKHSWLDDSPKVNIDECQTQAVDSPIPSFCQTLSRHSCRGLRCGRWQSRQRRCWTRTPLMCLAQVCRLKPHITTVRISKIPSCSCQEFYFLC